MPDAPVTPGQAVRELARRLADVGAPSPDVDARELVMFALGLTRTGLLTHSGPLTPSEAARLEALASRRLSREPLQHLLGQVYWGDLTLKVTPAALIPRPETEALLALALDTLRERPAPRVVDVGTGTGALALGVAQARPDAVVIATDVSSGALALARENMALNGLTVQIQEANLLTGVAGPFDLVLSNPPYLPEQDREQAEPEVRHDPELALYSGPDGLDLARELSVQARRCLKPGGALALELDPRNVQVLAAELRVQGWTAQVWPDLTGRERFLTAHRT